jgi:hypothetical protein
MYGCYSSEVSNQSTLCLEFIWDWSYDHHISSDHITNIYKDTSTKTHQEGGSNKDPFWWPYGSLDLWIKISVRHTVPLRIINVHRRRGWNPLVAETGPNTKSSWPNLQRGSILSNRSLSIFDIQWCLLRFECLCSAVPLQESEKFPSASITYIG